MSSDPDGHLLLTGVGADRVLRTALASDGVEVTGWRRTRVHPRGRAMSVRFDVDVTGADRPTLDVVAHTSGRPVPPGAAVVDIDGTSVHVWRVPHDPYLPGLPPAMSPASVQHLLEALGVHPGEVSLTVRAYRPTRRAVVEVRSTSGHALYLKVLGDRTPERVARRADDLAEVHRGLTAAGVPVPALVGVAARQGIVAIANVSGDTLRAALLRGRAVPDPTALAALSAQLLVADVETRADPRAYADIGRHVPLLAAAVPDATAALDEVHAATLDAGGPEGTVHGDLHDGQLLVADGEVSGLLDLDGVGTGLLAHDAGRMIAYLEHAAEVPGAPRDPVTRYIRELATAYAAHGLDDSDLARGAAAAWIGLATAPYRSRHDGWQDEVRNAIERAQRWARSIG